jgi:hypothetical protein
MPLPMMMASVVSVMMGVTPMRVNKLPVASCCDQLIVSCLVITGNRHLSRHSVFGRPIAAYHRIGNPWRCQRPHDDWRDALAFDQQLPIQGFWPSWELSEMSSGSHIGRAHFSKVPAVGV